MKSREPAQSEKSSRKNREQENEGERINEGKGKKRSRIFLHCMDCLLEQGGACRGRDIGDSYQCGCESRRRERKRQV